MRALEPCLPSANHRAISFLANYTSWQIDDPLLKSRNQDSHYLRIPEVTAHVRLNALSNAHEIVKINIDVKLT